MDEQLEWEKAFKKVVASCLLIEDLRTTDLKQSKQLEEDSPAKDLPNTKVDDGPSQNEAKVQHWFKGP